MNQIEICRGDEECRDKTADTRGSLLTKACMTDWIDSPTGRMRMKRSGIRMSTTRNLGGMIDGIYKVKEYKQLQERKH